MPAASLPLILVARICVRPPSARMAGCIFAINKTRRAREMPAIEMYGRATILACLTVLQDSAAANAGLDYLQVFESVEKPEKLWFIEDGPGGARIRETRKRQRANSSCIGRGAGNRGRQRRGRCKSSKSSLSGWLSVGGGS